MTKKIIIVFLSILTFSCNDNNDAENTLVKIASLKQENDSLKNVLTEINRKYVFDSISIREIPRYDNTYLLNSTVITEIVFVAYNSNGLTSVILADSISYGTDRTLVNPDTLEMKNGGFIYEVELNEHTTYLNGLLTTGNEYGKSFERIYKTAIRANKN